MDQLPTIQRRSDEKFCRACAAVMHQSAEFCTKCGAKQAVPVPAATETHQVQKAADQKYCHACASVCHISAAACPKCGAPLLSAGGAVGEKSKAVAIVLALLLGGIGAHKFYLGKPLMGLLYLIFFWTFIPAIAAFIEGIYYATLDDTTFQQRARLGTL